MSETGKLGEKLQPKKLSAFLYYLALDQYYFESMPPEASPLFPVGCSSVRKGDLYGRNLDLGYCDTPEFVTRVGRSPERFASIGVCADLTAPTNVDEITDDQLLSMPNITNDGINENGVIVNVNVVDAGGVDSLRGTAPGKQKIHASRMVRYLLDHAASAAHAVQLMKEVDIVGGFSGFGLHWMIADARDTYVVEIIGSRLSVSKNQYYYMTNFYLNYGERRKEQYLAGTLFRDVPLLNEYAIGVERWCMIRERYPSISSEADMVGLLAAVRGTAMYNKANDPLWYSECTGGTLSIHSAKTDFDQELKEQMRHFEERDRANSKGDWISWHSSVYNIPNRSLLVYSQEDYSEAYRFQL